MSLPKHIKIGNYTIKILYKKVLKDPDDPTGRLCGLTDIEKSIIYLQKNLEKNRKKDVFLHELFHAISDIFDLHLPEKTVNSLSVILLDVIRRNNLQALFKE